LLGVNLYGFTLVGKGGVSGDHKKDTITITAADGSKNSSQASVEIIVPHDKGKKK